MAEQIDFQENPLNNTTPSKFCLDVLFAFFFQNRRELKASAESILYRLSALLDITEDEAKMLSYMAYGAQTPWRDARGSAQFLGITLTYANKLLRSLVDKHAVEFYSGGRQTVYRACESYIAMLKRMDAEADMGETQLHEQLHTYAGYMLDACQHMKNCTDLFEEIVAVANNLTFSRGYRALGVNGFTPPEKAFFLILADAFLHQGLEPVRPSSLKIVGSDDSEEGNREPSRPQLLMEGMRGLVQRGIAVLVQCEADTPHKSGEDRDLCLLSAGTCAKLFKGQIPTLDYRSLSHFTTMYKAETIKQKDLYFDPDFHSDVKEIRTLLTPEKYELFARRLEEKGLSKSINILFHGEPGTGKTELAMQFARESGRDIFIADLAKLEDSYVGESEKNYRQLFRSFNYANAVSANPPILLLNEADGIIGKRVTVERSFDKFSNSLQNILLEEMERFEGVLIATTNLTVNMDKAFERRFPFKLCFKRPMPETAYKIWKERMPFLSRVEALRFAKEFHFSGGQIDNIAKRCDLFEVIYGMPPGNDQVAEYCRAETADAPDDNGRVIINGFLPTKNK